ncbi:MAG TPA: hypothetical protein VIL95_02030 [Bacillota bacterium]
MAETWIVLSPAGVRAGEALVEARLERPQSGQMRIGFLSNRKPNTVAWQRWVARQLEQERPGLHFAFYEKTNPAVGAGQELLDQITEECSLVITGTGD